MIPQLPKPETERIHALDNLRALAMFLGILLHAGMTFMPSAPLPYHDARAHWVYDVTFMFIHGFRMHLFFFLAGFFGRLLHERLGTVPFAKHRLKRIALPFALGLPLFVLPTLLIILWGAVQLNDPSNVRIVRPPGSDDGFPSGHLWFLQFLIFMYAAALPILWATRHLTQTTPGQKFIHFLDTSFNRLLKSPLRIFIFVPFTVACLWNGPIWGEPEFPAVNFVPEPRAVAHYSLFFIVGWCVHRLRSSLNHFGNFLGSSLLIALLCMLMHLALLNLQPSLETPNYLLLKTISLTCAAIYAWSMTFAMTGLFLRFGNAENPKIRYLADASYWCYLAHLPIIVLLQVLVAPWQIPALLKITLIATTTTAALLFLYEHRVRYSWVGAILNGPRAKNPSQKSNIILPAQT